MIQFILIIISIIYGFIYGIITSLLKKNIILFSLFSILATFLYVFILYKLYNGNISLLLKISLVIGFILCKVLEKTVKLKKHK